MKSAAVAFAAACSLLMAGSARADVACLAASNTQFMMSIEKAIEKAESFGYTVWKTKRSKGCWEIEGFDRNGAKIELRIDPASGDVVRSRD
jgi:hypothetical protein